MSPLKVQFTLLSAVFIMACGGSQPVSDQQEESLTTPSDATIEEVEPQEVSDDSNNEKSYRESTMTLDHLHSLLAELDPNVKREANSWRAQIEGVEVIAVADAHHDRMRIIAPITSVGELEPVHIMTMLEANFHSALDARYATRDNVVFAAFIHPLSPLTDEEFVSAVRQVVSLVQTFGTSYSSGVLQFGG